MSREWAAVWAPIIGHDDDDTNAYGEDRGADGSQRTDRAGVVREAWILGCAFPIDAAELWRGDGEAVQPHRSTRRQSDRARYAGATGGRVFRLHLLSGSLSDDAGGYDELAWSARPRCRSA